MTTYVHFLRYEVNGCGIPHPGEFPCGVSAAGEYPGCLQS
jgi:hypothetical protein